jgi:hypothetical protein
MTANAGFVLEGSLGTGYAVSPEIARGRIPTQVMIAPGYGLGEMLRLELGLNFALGDIEGGQFDMQLRPMLVIDPPLFPLYARAVVAFANLINDAPFDYAIGGAAGVSFSLAGLGIFAEAGVIPFIKDTTVWTIEGRVGVYWAM